MSSRGASVCRMSILVETLQKGGDNGTFYREDMGSASAVVLSRHSGPGRIARSDNQRYQLEPELSDHADVSESGAGVDAGISEYCRVKACCDREN